MSPHERSWLLGSVAAMAAALLVAILAWQRWTEARRQLGAREGMPAPGAAPSETTWSAMQDRRAACHRRLPAAGSPASRQAQQAILDLVQRHGLEIAAVMPHAEADLGRIALPACPGWPAVVMELRGRSAFAVVTAILADLPSLPTVVLPMEVELLRGGTGPIRNATAEMDAPVPPPAAADTRIQVRLVLAL